MTPLKQEGHRIGLREAASLGSECKIEFPGRYAIFRKG
jgi:hypothetical protein